MRELVIRRQGGPGRQRGAAPRRSAPAGHHIRNMTPETFWQQPRPSSTPWPTRPTTSTSGASGPGPRSRRPATPPLWLMSRTLEAGIPETPGNTFTTLGPRSTKLKGSHQLARGTNQVLRNPSSIGENHPAGQRDHRHAPGEAGPRCRRTTEPYQPEPSSPEWARPNSEQTQRSEEQVLDLLVSHRHLIPVARKGHYMMMVAHS